MDWSDARVPHSEGLIAQGFEAVGEAFAANFKDDLEHGAGFAVVADGQLLVDIRGGHADRKNNLPWTQDTLACIYSCGKAVLSLLIAREVSEGRLDYEKPVAAYWPEFGQSGKEAVTVAQLLSHQAGLCGIAEEMSPQEWLDWDAIARRLAAMPPLSPPGSANGYGPQTFGYAAGELLRRTTGGGVGRLLDDLRAQQDHDVYCGVSGAVAARVAVMTKPPKAPDLGVLNNCKEIAFLKSWSAPARVSREDWMAAEIPASNMHANALSLARLLHPFARLGAWPDGDAYLTQEAIEAAFKERIRGEDLVLPFHLSWAAGLMRNINRHFGPNLNAYGHAGFGGSCVVIDPDNRLTAAYVMNKMSPHLVGDPRGVRLLDALYDCL